MNKVFKGAVLGGVIGVAVPIALAIGNEFMFAGSNGDSVEAKICFANRLWNLQRIQVKHAPGCKNKILESIPQILLVSVLGGSLLGALSLVAGKAQTGDRTSRQSLLSKAQEENIEIHKPQEPVASKPPSEEPVGKGLSEGFDLNPILRMSAIGGAIALVGFGAYISYRNSPGAWNGSWVPASPGEKSQSGLKPEINQSTNETSRTSANAQSAVEPAPKYPMCIYGNRAKGTQRKFPCRVIIDGKNGEVTFIDEYASRSISSKMLARHDGNQGWYSPVLRKGECMLRGQGVEYICIGKPWSGV